MMKNIEILPNEDICFVKKISFAPRNEELYKMGFYGVFYYGRPITKQYKMKEINENEWQNRIYAYKEEDYPKDLLDKIIFDSIKENFSDVKVRTSLQMFDVERDENRELYKRNNGKDTILTLQIDNQLVELRLGTTIFTEPEIKDWIGETFNYTIDNSKTGLLEQILALKNQFYKEYNDVIKE